MVKNLPAMQETRVRSSVGEDPTCRGACAAQLLSLGAVTTEDPSARACAPPREACAPQLESSPPPRSLQLEKSLPRNKDLAQPKTEINQQNYSLKNGHCSPSLKGVGP